MINKKIFNIIILFFAFLIPWIVVGLNSDISPEKITSDLRFYETNTCEISLFDFILKNPNTIYQDHYVFNANHYSSIGCFGSITGIDQINHVFYISIGTSSYILILLQTFIWCIFFSFIKKKKYFQLDYQSVVSLIASSLLLISSIYIEERFYLGSLYAFDYESVSYFLNFFLIVIFCGLFCIYILDTRLPNLFNFLPFIFLFIGVYGGFNFHIHMFYLIYLGIKRVIESKKLWINKYYLFFLLLLWFNNSYKDEYFLDPDKFRGFTSSIFTDKSTIIWSIFFVFSLNGLIKLINENRNNINFVELKRSFFYSSLLILFLGYFGSANPLLNFFNFIFFGQNKVGITRENIFQLNDWGERMAWRGFFPSAETIGEFFGIAILFYIFLLLRKKIIFNIFDLFPLFLIFFGLLGSNNRSSLIGIFFVISLFLIFEFKPSVYKIISLLAIFLLLATTLIGTNNLQFNTNYLSESLLNDAISYSFDNEFSSSLEFLLDSNNMLLTSKLISLLSIVSFYINRSELWGIFFARYNPEFQEFFFGSGLMNFGKLYGGNKILDTSSFLLPHSSLFSFLVFVGFLNLCIIVYYLFKNLSLSYKKNGMDFYVSLFILINLIKSDSLNYLPAMILYSSIILINVNSLKIYRNKS